MARKVDPLLSTFTWLDYSDSDRRRALDVVDLFKETQTLDELGIGSIRDGLADELFPGTSTIQTRARYFLLIPWLFRRLEDRGVPSAQMVVVARRAELALNEAIMVSKEAEGGFGALAGRNLRRLASTVYWSGMASWGIRVFPGSQSDYHRSMDRFLAKRKLWRSRKTEDEEQDAPPTNWHPRLPAAPDGFPDEASLRLRHEDAAYLQDRIIARHPNTLLGWIASEGRPELVDVPEPWVLLSAAGLPSDVANVLLQARRFSRLIHGGSLLYNLMLAEAKPFAEKEEQYREGLARWAAESRPEEDDLRTWDLEELWRLIRRSDRRLPVPTQAFITRWSRILRDLPRWDQLSESRQARLLIEERESALKRNRARLRSRRHLELWGGTSGAAALNYRWRNVQVILGDILRGSA